MMTNESSKAQQLRCAVDVLVGVIPGEGMKEYCRRYYITSESWHADDGANQADLLSELAGKASAWATYCMLQPDRFNWVKTEWIWF